MILTLPKNEQLESLDLSFRRREEITERSEE
jgi:hypothetical protein